MNENLRNQVMILVCALIVSSQVMHAQNRFDTQPALSSEEQLENLNGSNANLHGILSAHSTLFDRSRGYFAVGLNWDGIINKNLKSIMGVTINDSYIYHRWDQVPDIRNSDWLSTNPQGTRIIAADGNVMFSMGYGAMTRVDFEIDVELPEGHPILEQDNTGALHGFADQGLGVVNNDIVELRTSQGASTYSGNTNLRIWDTRPTIIVVDEEKRVDHMRSGEFMVVGICLRRVGTVHEGDYDDAVLSIRLLRQKRLKYDEQLDIVSEDERGDRFVRFSFVPNNIEDYTEADREPNQIGFDELPHLFTDLGTGVANNIDSKFVGNSVYTEMPLFSAVSTTANITPREFVWNHLRDVRGETGNDDVELPDEREEIVITKGMLRRLIDNPAEYDPSTTSSNDGTSYWTIFEGLIVFDAIDDTKDIEDLFVYDPITSKYGLGAQANNQKYTRNGQRGNASGLYGTTSDPERGITDLFVEVKYYNEANVDVDYIVLQTPNARALMREQFRESLSSSIGRVVDEFAAASSANASMNYRLLGLRSPEEAGELFWYSQRYLNILTSGAMISEIDMKPFDRYVHCAYPFESSGSGSYPDIPLPLWTWNEGSTGRTNPLTPVPYIKNGGQSASDFYTMGYKNGVCGGAYNNNGVYTVGLFGACQATDFQGRILKSHDFDLGWPCQGSTQGSQDGWFSFFKNVPKSFWSDPLFFERVNTDCSCPQNPIDDPNFFPTDGDCAFSDGAIDALQDANNWTTTQLASVNLFNNFIYEGNSDFLFDGHQWLEQVWLGSGKAIVRSPNANNANEILNVQVSSWNQSRPMTGEEIRFRLMSPTLLGADGLMLFTGNYMKVPAIEQGDDIPQGSYQVLFNMQNIIDHATTASFDDVNEHARDDDYGKDYPTYAGTVKTQEFQLSIDNDNHSVKTEGYLENHYEGADDEFGNPTGEKLWYSKYAYTHAARITPPLAEFSIGGLDIVQRVNSNGTIYDVPTDATVEKLYIGSLSGRIEVLRYTDWLNSALVDYDGNGPKTLVNGQRQDDKSLSIQDEPETVKELLALLDLHAWYARGYKESHLWKDKAMQPESPLINWIDVSRISTRHPYREYNARADYESDDSVFIDVTLHQRKPNLADESYAPYNNNYINNEIYIGVQNRRQNPLYMEDYDNPESTSDDVPRFSSTQEFLALVAKPENGHRLYDQIGSRSVVLPFDYAYAANEKPKLFHVFEVGISDGPFPRKDVLYSHGVGETEITATRNRIDTIVDAKGVLEIDLLPGEGKLLRVRVLNATADAAVGNLAFNTQTKLVVAPEQLFYNNVPYQTGRVCYHMVYMAPNAQNEWRVYYKWSKEYPRDNLPDVAGLDWPNPAIELGDETTVRRQIGGRETIIQTANTAWVNAVYDPNADSPIQHGNGTIMRAGFPTITIARHVVRTQYENAPPIPSSHRKCILPTGSRSKVVSALTMNYTLLKPCSQMVIFLCKDFTQRQVFPLSRVDLEQMLRLKHCRSGEHPPMEQVHS